MTVLILNRSHLNVAMSTHNPYIDYYVNQALGNQSQIGRGDFYKGLPWQKGYGIGRLLGSFARRFVPLLKPLVKSAGKKLLRAGTSIVSDIIGLKPVGDVLEAGGEDYYAAVADDADADDSVGEG